jgi:hypothetical protein
MAMMKITLPNGAKIEVENTLSVEQVRDSITAAGMANLSGAQAVETVTHEGDRSVEFVEAAGTKKG